MATGPYLSLITLNVNGLNAPTKRQRLAEWIQKQDPYIWYLQETHLKTRDTYRLKVKDWKKIFHSNGDQKKAGVAMLISDKIDFKIKAYFLINSFICIYIPRSGIARYYTCFDADLSKHPTLAHYTE